MSHPIFAFVGRGQERLQPPPYAMEKFAYLRAMDIFRDLTPEEIGALERQTTMATCAKGRHIYVQGQQASGLFLLKRGRVRLSRLTASGKAMEIATIGPGTFFGDTPLFGQTSRNTDAEAIEECLICVLSREDMERIITERPAVALRIIEVLGRRIAVHEARLETLAYQDTAARVAGVLLQLTEDTGSATVVITHQELASMVGAVRETVTKVLDDLRADGAVRLERGRVHMLDLDKLRARL